MYCSLADVLVEIPEIRLVGLLNDEDRPQKDEDNPTGWDLTDTDDAIIVRLNGYIEKAGNEIDGYLSGQFVCPVEPVPARITDIAVIIVKHKLHMRRDVPLEESPAYADYKQVKRELADIRDGDVTISGLTALSATGVYRCNKTADDRVFTKEYLSNY
ncbi:MAG: DUF1320 family protein [Ignavibacteriales bacterium]|nr:DUF1320 family protein [Ignavibacteriales bacterium]